MATYNTSNKLLTHSSNRFVNYTTTFVIFLFLLGALYYIINDNVLQYNMNSFQFHFTDLAMNVIKSDISIKKQIQNEFFNLITELQSNCSNNRILIHKIFGDGFANIHHYIGQSLLLSLATNRRLFIVGNLHYVRCCKNHTENDNWLCIYNDISKCELHNNIITTYNRKYEKSIPHSLFKYYYSDKYNITVSNGHIWNHHFSGLTKRLFGSGIYRQEWLNKFNGNIWVRAHIQYYLWNTINDNSMKIINNHPIVKKLQLLKQSNGKFKYIGFHIRKTDNVKTVARDFEINTDEIYNLSYYMRIANNIRKQYVFDDLKLIYVCTDNDDIIGDIEAIQNGSYHDMGAVQNWEFIYNPQSNRAIPSAGFVWYLSKTQLFNNNSNINQAIWNILMDIELLSKADFLIGSSISNVFRLATELHFVTNWPKYDLLSINNNQTVFSVDIPWFQDP
eukprot:69699_1